MTQSIQINENETNKLSETAVKDISFLCINVIHEISAYDTLHALQHTIYETRA